MCCELIHFAESITVTLWIVRKLDVKMIPLIANILFDLCIVDTDTF